MLLLEVSDGVSEETCLHGREHVLVDQVLQLLHDARHHLPSSST